MSVNPKSAARLAAVQALYQSTQTDKSAEQIAEEFLSTHTEMELEDGKLARPDDVLFSKIVKGVLGQKAELQDIINAHKNESHAGKEFDSILNMIILSGVYELMHHHDVDAPIIINDYLNVTHAFYEKSEASLVNAILDKAQTIFRA